MNSRRNKFLIPVSNPLARAHRRWHSIVIGLTLYMQALVAPTLSERGVLLLFGSAESAELNMLQYLVTLLSFMISTGFLYYTVYKTGMYLYERVFVFKIPSNRQYAIGGYWDAEFTFKQNTAAKRNQVEKGYAVVTQDYLGRIEVSLHYGYEESLNRYKSTSNMSGFLTTEGGKSKFHIHFHTTHEGGLEYSGVPDDAFGTETVKVRDLSDDGYPISLIGNFFFNQRTEVKPLWNGNTLYTRSNELEINNPVPDLYESSRSRKLIKTINIDEDIT